MGSNQKRRRRFIKQSVTILVGIGILLGALFYARNLEQHQTHFYVKFKNPTGQLTDEFKLEIADSDSKRTKGLMYRKYLPPDEGMIFAFASESQRSFWMKNTYISLDMLFVNSNWQVVGILESVPVLNTEQRGVTNPSQYVIELAAGTAKRVGIETNSVVTFNGVPPKSHEGDE